MKTNKDGYTKYTIFEKPYDHMGAVIIVAACFAAALLLVVSRCSV